MESAADDKREQFTKQSLLTSTSVDKSEDTSSVGSGISHMFRYCSLQNASSCTELAHSHFTVKIFVFTLSKIVLVPSLVYMSISWCGTGLIVLYMYVYPGGQKLFQPRGYFPISEVLCRVLDMQSHSERTPH